MTTVYGLLVTVLMLAQMPLSAVAFNNYEDYEIYDSDTVVEEINPQDTGIRLRAGYGVLKISE